MEKLNKLTVFDMCVKGSGEGAKERFKDLIGPLFGELNSFYDALRNTSARATDIDVITYRRTGSMVEFTLYAPGELRNRDQGTSSSGGGVTVHIPITKGGELHV